MAEKGSSAVGIFLIKLLALYVLWFGLHDHYLVPKTTVVYYFICFQTKVSVLILKALPIQDIFEANQTLLLFQGKRILTVGEECSGLILFAVFGGFILSFPGDWFSKAWFIPLGIFFILVLNILRISILAVNKVYFNSIFAFNHHVTFTYGMYAIIFGLWYVWMKYLRKIPTHEN